MAYGPVNASGASGGGLSDADLEKVTKAVQAAQDAANEAKKLVTDLKNSISDGTIIVQTKAVFPVVETDPENPEQGEAWILKKQAQEAEN